MVQLGDCPNEIQLSILGLLSSADLLSMCMIGKQLHDLPESLLYSAVDMKWTKEYIPPITLLLRSILDRPELGYHVHTLHLDGGEFKTCIEMDDPLHQIPVAALQIDKALVMVQHNRVPRHKAKFWMAELQSGTMEAIVAVLLSILPNLRTLHLEPNFTVKTTFLVIMLRSALCKLSEDHSASRFQNLNCVTFDSKAHLNCPRVNKNTADVLPFFYLPKIQHLIISIDNTTEFVWAVDTPHPSSLRYLKLYKLREMHLEPLLLTLSGLQSLHWGSSVASRISKPNYGAV